jgi:hypothetical protein
MATRPGFIWSGTEWVAIGQEAIVNPFYYQATQPTTPSTGDIWIESDVDVPSVDSAQFLRWRKTMVGGETSLSGNDDSSLPLGYTPGYEQLYINGVLMVRGVDYTATDGTTVTGLTALVADEVVEIFSTLARTVADVYTQTQVDSKLGDSGWTSWTPTLTNWSVVNGTFTNNKYVQIGRTVHFSFSYVIGSSDTKSGAFTYSLPVAGVGSALGNVRFTCAAFGASTYPASATISTSTGQIFHWDASLAIVRWLQLTATAPGTFATGDNIQVFGTYEAA